MNLPTLHRNAVIGLLVREEKADEEYRRGQEARKVEWSEVLGSIEGALGLPPGSMGTTHTLDVQTMQVELLQTTPAPEPIMTPAVEEQ